MTMTGVSFFIFSIYFIAVLNGHSTACMNTRPTRSMTPTFAPVFECMTIEPFPGASSPELAGRNILCSLSMASRISFLSHIWSPFVRTSMPISKSSFAISGVMPAPPAAFSEFPIVKSIFSLCFIFGRRDFTASRPGLPTISPIKSIFIGLFSVFYRAGLAYHGYLYLARILHAFFYLLFYLAGKDSRLSVGYLRRLNDDPYFAPGLYCVCLFDTLERIRDLFKFLETLYVYLERFASCAGSRAGYGISGAG